MTMEESKVRIRLPKDWKEPCGTRVWINGNEVRGIKTVGIEHEAGEVRLLTLSLYADLEVFHDNLKDDVDFYEGRPPTKTEQTSDFETAVPNPHD